MYRTLSFILRLSIVAVAIVGLVACRPTAASPTALPSATPAALPTSTVPSVTTTSAQEATATPAAQQTVQIFFIALEDAGRSGKKIGCDDSVVPVQVNIPQTEEPVLAALQALLAVHSKYYGGSGLYTALDQSTLWVESVKVEGGKAVVRLAGQLMLGGVCDSPRVQAQLEETVLQFEGVDQADIYINGRPLSEVLSSKG